MGGRRGATKALLAVLLAAVSFSLGGCAVVGSIADKGAIDLGLAALETELKESADIDSLDSTAELQVDFSYRITVTATADEIDDAQLLEVAARATATLGFGVFAREQVNFELVVDDGRLLSLNAFGLSPAELRAELEYRSALSAAYGKQLAISLSKNEEGYARFIATLVAPWPESIDWNAMRAIRDGTTMTYRDWSISGISGSGALPGERITDMVGELAAVAPMFDPLDPLGGVGFRIDLYGSNVDVSLVEPGTVDLKHPASAPSWPQLLATAELVAAAQLTTPNLGYQGDGGSGAAFAHFGDCAIPPYVRPEDAALALDLHTEGWHAGHCEHGG